jgi:23S rRNA pseudouridine2605 synthase
VNRARREPQGEGAGERLHKVLARLGWGSRREIERWIAAGRVRVDGRRAELGTLVRGGEKVQLDDGRSLRVATSTQPLRVLAYNKPAGEVCTRHDPEGRPDVFAKLPRLAQGRWVNVGRLDINTSGLLLFTNHGELAHRLMHPRYRIDREYAARIFGEVDAALLAELRAGIEIEGERYHFDDIVEGEGDGANRWYYCVRRLWEAAGVQVSRLMRVRFGNVMLPTDLRAGRSVEVGGQLLTELCRLVDLSPRAPSRPRGPAPD